MLETNAYLYPEGKIVPLLNINEFNPNYQFLESSKVLKLIYLGYSSYRTDIIVLEIYKGILIVKLIKIYGNPTYG